MIKVLVSVLNILRYATVLFFDKLKHCYLSSLIMRKLEQSAAAHEDRIYVGSLPQQEMLND
jgi:hypothetical protein